MYKRAVVFAYHSVGVRCLQVLLARGVEVALVVSHEDNPNETIWFESVRALCQQHGIPCITPDAAALAEVEQQVAALAPDLIFSFYYRHMLPVSLLNLAKGGAYNMHGSLLPKYRGRVPVNWAVLHGEVETGMSLHEMAAKPDAGAIIDQSVVPILPDETAFQVFGKLTVLAEQILWRSLPAIMAGTPPKLANDLSKGSYFGGRNAEQGRIDWQQNAQQVYNLHRAVAPPYPGAFTDIGGARFVIGEARMASKQTQEHTLRHLPLGLNVVGPDIFGVCGDGEMLWIKQLLRDGQEVSAKQLQEQLVRAGGVAGVNPV